MLRGRGRTKRTGAPAILCLGAPKPGSRQAEHSCAGSLWYFITIAFIHCCTTNHSQIGWLKIINYYWPCPVFWSGLTQLIFMVRKWLGWDWMIKDGLTHISYRWLNNSWVTKMTWLPVSHHPGGLLGFVHMVVVKRFLRAARERTSSSVLALFKPLLASPLLILHWPKQVIWPSPDSRSGELPPFLDERNQVIERCGDRKGKDLQLFLQSACLQASIPFFTI